MGHRQSPSSTVASAIRLQRSVALCTVPPTPFWRKENELDFQVGNYWICVICHYVCGGLGHNHLGGGSFHFQVLVDFLYIGIT